MAFHIYIQSLWRHVRHNISISTGIPLHIYRKAAPGSRDSKLYLLAWQTTQDIPWAPLLTSPIMTASSGAQPVPLRASRKNVFSGFPTTMAVVSVAYSKAVTNGPGPRAKPSFLLKYLALWTAIRGAPSRSNLERRRKWRQTQSKSFLGGNNVRLTKWFYSQSQKQIVSY